MALIGVYLLLDNLSLPIRSAVTMDQKEKTIEFWRMSELYVNLGRVVLFGLSAVSLYFEMVWVPFALFAVLAATFPLVVHKTEVAK